MKGGVMERCAVRVSASGEQSGAVFFLMGPRETGSTALMLFQGARLFSSIHVLKKGATE